LKQIAPAVTVSGVPVGGLTSERARLRVQQRAERPLIVHVGTHWWSVEPSQLGAVAAVDTAVSQALDARQGARVAVQTGVSLPPARAYVRSLAPQVHVAPTNAKLIGVVGNRPQIQAGNPGVDLDRPAAVGAIRWALRHGLHRPLTLPVKTVQPWRTAA